MHSRHSATNTGANCTTNTGADAFTNRCTITDTLPNTRPDTQPNNTSSNTGADTNSMDWDQHENDTLLGLQWPGL